MPVGLATWSRLRFTSDACLLDVDSSLVSLTLSVRLRRCLALWDARSASPPATRSQPVLAACHPDGRTRANREVMTIWELPLDVENQTPPSRDGSRGHLAGKHDMALADIVRDNCTLIRLGWPARSLAYGRFALNDKLV